ncbi:MAG: acetyl-CoA carboxylase biotin carboxyl carrier protein [Bdellovibrionota bacterium]
MSTLNLKDLNLKDLAAILEMLDKHQVSEFKLERGEEKLFLRRGKSQERKVRSMPAYPQMVVAPQQMPSNVIPLVNPVQPAKEQSAVQSISTTAAQPAAAPQPVEVAKRALKEITSPMVGTFYRRPAVDAEPYVQVGDTVKKGDVLCIVEAMKLMNEIESEAPGKIVEICLEDGQMVEYGEVLFRMESA